MKVERDFRIALAGKPNSGKSSLFNQLTGLNQKIGNFPGVTVDKKVGYCQLNGSQRAEILDLPGIYSLYPRTEDERIVTQVFANHNSTDYPDLVVLVADATNLKSCFLLLTQLIDLKLPVVLALNMVDLAAKSGQSIDIKALTDVLQVPVVLINARKGLGLQELREAVTRMPPASPKTIYKVDDEIGHAVRLIKERFELRSDYEAYQYLQQMDDLPFLSANDRKWMRDLAEQSGFFHGKFHGAETILRYEFIQQLLNRVIVKLPDENWKEKSYQLDRILTHKVWGYAIFFSILLVIFQSIFAWAEIPMDLIDGAFANLSNYLRDLLPAGPLSDLLTQGVIPGIGGIVIFIPQIAILFAFIAILEETGYMARVVFLMDKLMRRFGLSGKSVVPLISGWACAIPAIMATRTIENWKDRLITIFVTPLMSCSARLPVFAILVGLVVPNTRVLGVFNLQGLALMGLYLLGFAAAILSAIAMKFLIRARERSYLIMELPTYRLPRWSNVGYMIVEKTKTFVVEAGKIILAISIILWVLASYGPAGRMRSAEETARAELARGQIQPDELEARTNAYKLENSYAGLIGKSIEPVIRPLGYDWKIGIALITSFAAREVFVGTMATIYSVGNTEDQTTIRSRLQAELNPATGGPRFTPAVGLSLLVFYTFAMQCMSTLAIVKRETKSWRWPLLQLGYMSLLAYLSSLLVYQLLS
ncbi:MAG: ferrous iron transport protein B [Cyclobacteriaceae bacterium]